MYQPAARTGNKRRLVRTGDAATLRKQKAADKKAGIVATYVEDAPRDDMEAGHKQAAADMEASRKAAHKVRGLKYVATGKKAAAKKDEGEGEE